LHVEEPDAMAEAGGMGVSAYRRIGVWAYRRIGVWAYGRMGAGTREW
jgi:hypothetical protein